MRSIGLAMIIVCYLFSISNSIAQNKIKIQPNKFKTAVGIDKQDFRANAMTGQLVPDASFLGTITHERVAYAMSGGGDVNGDGYDDFLLGTFHNNVSGSDGGAVYLVLGRPAEQWAMHDSATNANAIFYGGNRYRAAGYSVANNGDLNGDGIDDMLIGACAGNDKIASFPGRAYVVLGSTLADWGDNFILPYRADAAFDGENGQDRAGVAVAIVGDINADGYDDFLVGAPDFDYNGKESTGKAYLVLGRATEWSLNKHLGWDSKASFINQRENASVGFSVAGAGDVNHDGIPDLLIGAPGISRSYVIFGRQAADWGQNFDLDNADLVIRGEQYSGEKNGYCVRGAGDVNGDGIDDMLIGAVHNRTSDLEAGKAYLVFGRDSGWSTNTINLSNADASFYGEDKHDLAGFCLSPAGDTNGDGFDDILIGMFNDINRDKPGKAWFIYGKESGWTFDQPLTEVPDYFIGEHNGDLTGFCVSNAGDVDGDQWDDFLVAAPYNSRVGEWSGQVYLFRSKRPECEISGKVNYVSSGLPVPVVVQLGGTGSATDSTDNAGHYFFKKFSASDYRLSLSKEKNEDLTDACITAYDAALAAKHTLHQETLADKRWQAADVNLDSSVTMFDAALILHYSLAIAHEGVSFAGEWVFDPPGRSYPALAEDYPDQNYVSFVRGDVDASWQLPGASLAKPTSPDAVFYNTIFIRDKQIVLPVILNCDEEIRSFGATVLFDPALIRFSAVNKTGTGSEFCLEYNLVHPGKLKIGAFTTHANHQSGIYANICFDPITGSNCTGNLKIESLRINGRRKQVTSEITTLPEQKAENIKFQLSQNYPNPFNSETLIQYTIPSEEHVKLTIHNILGQVIRTIVCEQQKAGQHRARWDGKDAYGKALPTGIYFYKLSATDFQQIRKLILIQ